MVFASSDRIMVLGSCFAAALGERLLGKDGTLADSDGERLLGKDGTLADSDGESVLGKGLPDRCNSVCINPFGTLFNPVSIHSSLVRLRSPQPFTGEDCVQMGAGSGLWCSFSHYTRFARPTREEFLANANACLTEASEFFRTCTHLVITFGTAWCFLHKEQRQIVSNCLKRPAAEFERFCLSVNDIVALYEDLDSLVPKGCTVIFTVSPIRHLADGAHGNQLSKSTLLLATEEIVRRGGTPSHLDSLSPSHLDPCAPSRLYFPAYEIMLDELRDYRWYAEDGVHPSEAAKAVIFDRFEKDFR